MTTEEQLENLLEPFKQDPQEIIDNCWQHADIYSSANPVPHSSICTHLVSYDSRVWEFLSDLSEGNPDFWRSLLMIVLLFAILFMAIISIEIRLHQKVKR